MMSRWAAGVRLAVPAASSWMPAQRPGPVVIRLDNCVRERGCALPENPHAPRKGGSPCCVGFGASGGRWWLSLSRPGPGPGLTGRRSALTPDMPAAGLPRLADRNPTVLEKSSTPRSAPHEPLLPSGPSELRAQEIRSSDA